MFHAMDRGRAHGALRHRREPGAVRRRPASRRATLLGGSIISSCRTSSSRRPRELAHVVLPASASWCEAEGTVTNSERRVQRVRKAHRAAAATRATSSGSSRRSRSGSATTSGIRRAEDVWNELRVARAACSRRHELRAPRGARRHSVAVPRRVASRGSSSCTAPLGAIRAAGRSRRSPSCSTTRRSSSRTRSIRSCSPPGAGSSPTTPACRRAATTRRCTAARRSTSRPKTPSARHRRRRPGARHVAARDARGAGAHRLRAQAGARVHDAALPRRRGDQPPDDRRVRPEVGHGGVQGVRGARRDAVHALGHGARDHGGAADAAWPPTDGHPAPRRRADRRGARRRRCAARRRRRPAWDGGARGDPCATRTSRSAAATRARSGICCCPRCRRCSRASGWISEGALDYVCDAAERAAGRCVGRRDVLRAVRDVAAAAAGGARLRRHRLQVPRRGRADRRRSSTTVGPAHHAPTGDHVDVARLRVDAVAVPRHVRPGAGGARAPSAGERRARRLRRPRHRDRRDGVWRRRARSPTDDASRRRQPTSQRRPADDAAAARARRTRRSDAASTPTARRGGYAALTRALEIGRRGGDRRGDRVEAAGPRRRRVSDGPKVGRGRASSRRRRTTSSATPTSRSRARSRIAC